MTNILKWTYDKNCIWCQGTGCNATENRNCPDCDDTCVCECDVCRKLKKVEEQ